MSTCFYCGGEHITNACPINAQHRTTSAIEKIGNKQLSEMSKTTGAINNLANLYEKSAENMSDSLNKFSEQMSQSLGDITNAIGDLANIFEHSHAEMMWQMEKQLNVLTGIHHGILTPRSTEANELFLMATETFRQDDIEESLRLLQEAITLNPTDYRIYVSMGHIYVRKDDLKNALDRFERGLKYAKINYHKSYCLLLISRVYYCQGDIKTAINKARLATELSPKYLDVRYQYIAYKAKNIKRIG